MSLMAAIRYNPVDWLSTANILMPVIRTDLALRLRPALAVSLAF